MVTNKTEVQVYLETSVLNALTEYADKNRLTFAQAIANLLENVLIKTGNCNSSAIASGSDYETRLAIVEENIRLSASAQRCLVHTAERMDEQLAVLEDNLARFVNARA